MPDTTQQEPTQGGLITQMLEETQTTLMVTYDGEQGELRDPIPGNLEDERVRSVAQEALRNGSVRGIDAHPDADLTDFVVSRYPAKDGLPARVAIRAKVPLGG